MAQNPSAESFESTFQNQVKQDQTLNDWTPFQKGSQWFFSDKSASIQQQVSSIQFSSIFRTFAPQKSKAQK